MSGPFDDWTNDDLAALIAAHPLAWVVTHGERFRATPLPILLERDAGGAPVSLIGHFGRSNPQLDAVYADRHALFLFQGPHRYISPDMAGRPDWGPTWNYAIARIEAEIDLDPAFNDEAVARLIAAMERDRPDPWTADQLGARYDALIRHIVAFRARITHVDARFKLGQDEADAVFDTIVDHLSGDPLAGWMQRMGRRGR
ncbi:FMN-binding negative transcriptional regulator [Sphingomonas koreensis]|nr:FMN-binding negative transcriptional regulator [Sphingomonas koreensis]